jgi:hypothetical protein
MCELNKQDLPVGSASKSCFNASIMLLASTSSALLSIAAYLLKIALQVYKLENTPRSTAK